MTLVFTGFGNLIQHSFGANEISSMIHIGKAIGSVVTRQSDASIFEPLATEYGIHVTRIPPWLHRVQFDRQGTILGDRQRQVHMPNTLANVSIDSIEGIATFLVLILRYVESPSDIVDDIQDDLLHGMYDIVNGGLLRLLNAPVVSGEVQNKTLPYSLRGVLRSFVNGVIDADAVSPQRNTCMTLMTQLTCIVGGTSFLRSSLKYVKMEHQKLLSHMLSFSPTADHSSEQCFNTFSAGAAMVCLAAAANGANMLLECMKDDGVVQIEVPGRLSTYGREPPRIVRLWLTQPPTTIMREIKVEFQDFRGSLDDDELDLHSLPVYGGMLEISSHVSSQLRCNITAEESLALWQGAVSVGRRARFRTQHGINRRLSIVLSEEFLESNIPASIGRLADNYYRVPRGDYRHRLARKAASVLHETFKYSDYNTFGDDSFKTCLDLVIVALFVGTLESIITNLDNRMLCYAWTLSCERTLGLAEKYVDAGLSMQQIMTQAARVWGGVTLPTLHSTQENESDVVGIICPQIIFLCNVLQDPKQIARVGISKGFMTWYEGSSPILPREQDTGFVLGGMAPYSRPCLSIDAAKPLPNIGEEGAEPEDFGPLLFSAEPCTTGKGSLAIVLCIWHLGDLIMVLDPAVVLTNLLVCRSLQQHVQSATDIMRSVCNAVHLTPDFLQWLECGLTICNGIGVIEVSGRLDWQVVAAGVNASSRVMLISDESEMRLIRDSNLHLWDGWVFILGGEVELAPTRTGNYIETRPSVNTNMAS